jgi:hypothetical protein
MRHPPLEAQLPVAIAGRIGLKIDARHADGSPLVEQQYIALK